jgi:site-specific DNA-methyltransferase (adenine-specific)
MNHRYEQGDSFELLKTIPDQSIDFCLTDPPYFLDGLGDEWDAESIIENQGQKSSTIKSLPKGMKFDKTQGPRFQEFMGKVSAEVFRVLKPGGFFVSFSQARLYHRMTIAVEDSGFEIRDMLGWTYQGQAKAFSQDHIIMKQKDLTDQEKQNLIQELTGWKTPQLKPCIEPMCLAQKPTEGKFIDNWQKYGVGLVNVNEQWDGSFPGNIIQCNKPLKSEKGNYNNHVSVKPVKLCEHLIKLFTKPGYTVLDPFLGSGTTLVAAERTGRTCVGFELSEKYFSIIQQRLADEMSSSLLSTNLFSTE